jgi:glycerol transport system ATP-binding protein
VMLDGEIVQIGTPVELFERPMHTFVGHFIGSPGMNILPCELHNGVAHFAGAPIQTDPSIALSDGGASTTTHEIGVRPEFVTIAEQGIPADIVKISDTGRFRIVEARHQDFVIRLVMPEDEPVPEPGRKVCLRFDPASTRVYSDGRLNV